MTKCHRCNIKMDEMNTNKQNKQKWRCIECGTFMFIPIKKEVKDDDNKNHTRI